MAIKKEIEVYPCKHCGGEPKLEVDHEYSDSYIYVCSKCDFHFRIRSDNSGTPDDVCDGECGTAASDLNLNTLEITSGSTVSITAMVVTMPEA